MPGYAIATPYCEGRAKRLAKVPPTTYLSGNEDPCEGGNHKAQRRQSGAFGGEHNGRGRGNECQPSNDVEGASRPTGAAAHSRDRLSGATTPMPMEKQDDDEEADEHAVDRYADRSDRRVHKAASHDGEDQSDVDSKGPKRDAHGQ